MASQPPIPLTVSNGPDLTDRERLCLRWTAMGKTSWEISRILDRKEATVNFHLKNAVAKLNVSNRCQAAVVAVRDGLIDL